MDNKKLKVILDYDSKITWKLENIKKDVKALESLGTDYSIFQNAKISHRSLKKIKKLLDLVG